MKILTICQAYPSAQQPYAMAYVHTRAKAYGEAGHVSHVLSFACQSPYERDGVSVFPESQVDLEIYDVIAVHAANLRNHIRLLRGARGRRIVFFWHGHEALRASDYPPPYAWNRRRVHDLAKAAYDELKLPLLRRSLSRLARRNELGMVFVSQWMRDEFERSVRLDPEALGKTAIIPNAVHPAFLEKTYSPVDESSDFVTLRRLDESCYAVDLVLKFARANPDREFHLFGQGRMFDHVEKPDNVVHHDKFVLQEDIPRLLDRYRAALLPTRYDSQGVMACEMATYGIPLITSDIPVAREMVGDFSNVTLRGNDDFAGLLDPSTLNAGPDPDRRDRFDPARLAAMELELFDA